MKTTANTQINNLIQQALKISEKEIIRLAKNHLKKNPKLRHFYIAMGTYFFTDQNDDVKFNEKCKPLDNFISKWEDSLHLTSNPMMFTATSKITRDW